ncbi:FAR1 DNA-binding domain [Sesbania bispinosa]|nr:FAR1 DNA-binding domain [Sesbania bispinosa]
MISECYAQLKYVFEFVLPAEVCVRTRLAISLIFSLRLVADSSFFIIKIELHWIFGLASSLIRSISLFQVWMDTLSEDLFDIFMRTESNRKSDGVEPEKSNSPPKHNVDSDEIADGHKKISELTDEDIRALEFDSEEDGYVFYREYAKFIGFAVRKHNVYKDRNDVMTMRQFVCNKEGERSGKHLNRTDRKREANAITRTKCKV